MELLLQEKRELTVEEESTVDEPVENTEVITESAAAEKHQEEATTAEQQQAPNIVEEQCETPQAVQQKQDNVLNLNNEVVKMRKEVKRVRALIIRKLTRQIGALKKKKGKDADIERNQRRAARLLEEIHAIKNLVPDKVTKIALQKNFSFEQVCKDPAASISDRAIARIATHPQFSKKIEDIKGAVKAFKEERMKEGKPSEKMPKKADRTNKQHTDKEKGSNDAENKRLILTKHCETDIVESCLDSSSRSFPKVNIEQQIKHTETQRTANKNAKQSSAKDVERSKPQNKSREKNSSKLSEVPLTSGLEAESDLEFSDGDEKEYFDDSTEERFHKQSSAESEESDNDFFVGKVSKFKKKKKSKNTVAEKGQKTLEEKPSNPLKTDKVQMELDAARLKSKVTSLNSVFCASLARSKTGKGTSKGDGKFGEQHQNKGACDGNIDLQSKFHKQSKGKPKDSSLKYSKPISGDKTKKEQKNLGVKGHVKELVRQKDARGRCVFSSQASAQPLHPSWEASKKRKEQQGQILAFQGKKIKFDDSDD